jgi:hypothetical protein
MNTLPLTHKVAILRYSEICISKPTNSTAAARQFLVVKHSTQLFKRDIL